MITKFPWTRNLLLKALPVAGVALLLALVPFWVGSAEETPSVDEVRMQVERMFASESGPTLPSDSEDVSSQQTSPAQ
jgi:hypothetical protein